MNYPIIWLVLLIAFAGIEGITAGLVSIWFCAGSLVALFAALTDSRLEPKTLRLVYPDEGKEPCLALVEARKGGGAGLRVMPPLMIAQKGQKTEELKRIYQLEPLEESQNAR